MRSCVYQNLAALDPKYVVESMTGPIMAVQAYISADNADTSLSPDVYADKL